ncbi:MAG TPA: NADH-quinone oxidoreductase subunit B family protein [Chloroflexota bacterium]|nr:NADH-quinone oxidoreductase subunit B family protein [Chloroflexota bacterium]
MDTSRPVAANDPSAIAAAGNGHDGSDPETAAAREALRRRIAPFRRSLHIRHVDAGSDGSEEAEILALGNPFYDIHRLGLFFTPTPRHADILLVTGPVTRAMAEPLRRTYEAMPFPKLVVAAGTSACGGGIFGVSYATLGGVDKVLPVDVYIPGSPPSPLALLHGLLLAVGRLEQKVHAGHYVESAGGAS